MALADDYDALTSDRVYQQAYSHEEAVRLISEGDGRTCPEHFDPYVLQAFLDRAEEVRMVCLFCREDSLDAAVAP